MTFASFVTQSVTYLRHHGTAPAAVAALRAMLPADQAEDVIKSALFIVQ